MTDPDAIIAALQSALKTGLAGVQVNSEMLTSPTPPCVEITFGDPAIEYDETFGRGLDRWTLILRAMAGTATDIGAQKLLRDMLKSSGTQSIKAAVETDRQLGGVVQDCRVASASGYRQYDQAGRPPYLGVEFTVEILAVG